MSYHVVWFKRDFRLHDHAPLLEAAQRGSVLCLYVIEPDAWAQADAAAQHYAFIQESANAVDRALRKVGGQLNIAVGNITEVLDQLHAAAPFASLQSHEETGNGWSYRRDQAVAQWCRRHNVTWQEHQQFGVVRRLRHRDMWQSQWESFMARTQVKSPTSIQFMPWPLGAPCVRVAPPAWPSPLTLGLNDTPPTRRQHGGRERGLAILNQFLSTRSAQYRGGISSPLSASTACSRLSTHLAYGTLSLREVVQATRARVNTLPMSALHHRRGLQAFISRLYWHCHFIQKLESEPDIEFHNMHRGYDDLRENDWNALHFQALTQGRTGWPMVDACVAMLRETGWLNFRMRAMLVSVAAYPLWLHWREVGLWLARQFLDYEPGIHWSQMQMQSGTTGMNTTRVYNPIKQAHDHDPKGVFVRRWLPAMRKIPDTWLFEPWRMPPELQRRYGIEVGKDIPVPLVDLETATRAAKQRLYARKRLPSVQAAKSKVVEKHASRKRSNTPPRNTTPQNTAKRHQLDLDF
ncbi:cryptochrome/deoxyribodipyrimidine photo-lyase family protein [Pusillimonas sp. NJUB218]|uniref:cryptochrome/deoxyribodipyrimidine photo-lyase family protein n=1 Tax=Pusillimonas sp. NJUB218 TaxID=2023230 RepID=UPI000F4BF96B|nr:FAD-binding domain-containing protein [Pusillimonas sp. NJUB218]ROT45064.1 deoxyribodipyrimidine photolyase [Pusillimonas sp. NJUB218]